MKISAGSSKSKQNEREITLREVFEFIVQRWYWFLLSIIVCGGVTWCYLETCQPIYQRAASLMIKDDKEDYGDNVFVVVSGNSTDQKLNKLHLLNSGELMSEVVKKLHLDVSYGEKLLFRMQDLYKKTPVQVSFIDAYKEPANMRITPLSTEKCILNIAEQSQEVTMNDTVDTNVGKIKISITPYLTPEWYGKEVYVSRIAPEIAVLNYRSSVLPTSADESSLYIVKYSATSTQKADDILLALTEAYNNYTKRDKQKIAQNTTHFLNERITQISEELGTLSNELTDVQLKKNIASFEATGSEYAAQASKIRQESVQLETNLSLAKYIQGYLTDAATKDDLIPMVGGVSELGIDAQVQSYNNLMVQRCRLLKNSGVNNAVVMELENSLATTRSTIAKSISTYIDAQRIRLEQVRKQERTAQYSLTTDPAVYDSYRQKKIKESLYSFLLKKQEQNSLKMNNEEPIAKMIEQPYSSASVSPDFLKYLIAALMVALLLPVAVWWFMILLDPKVRNRQDVETATSLTVLGEIPAYRLKRKQEQSEPQVTISLGKNDAVSESFRILSTQLMFAMKGAKVVMLTSSTSGEGKSFISNNLSVMLTMLGKKVLLVDMDIRKSLNAKRGLTVEEGAGVSDFLLGKISDLKKLIVSHEDKRYPDVLPAGTMPQNPVELLMNDRLELMVAELKKEYDIILLDSVPAMGLADALVVDRIAECTLYVVREQMLDRRILPELEKLSQEGKLHNAYVVLNDCQFAGNSYKGYYAHNKYYGYNYSYGSYYAKEGKPQRRISATHS